MMTRSHLAYDSCLLDYSCDSQDITLTLRTDSVFYCIVYIYVCMYVCMYVFGHMYVCFGHEIKHISLM